MLTYELNKKPGLPLYEALYRCIRDDILSGRLTPGQKLPAKRALAANLEVSKITVEGAYAQLLAEGYIRSVEKVGCFVEAVPQTRVLPLPETSLPDPADDRLDLTANSCTDFPFSVWSRLQREVMLDLKEQLLQQIPNQGVAELRRAIAAHLAQFRGMQVSPDHILVGAGTDFLYNLLIQLLGREKVYAIEEPGYDKIRRIYHAGGVRCSCVRVDARGVSPAVLGDAQVLHISPSHHFPTGLVTPLERRRELLNWAGEGDRYIIEDDYDSEFRFHARPVSSLQSLDTQGRVIYMNTFSKTLAPSIRISYMVLPAHLMARFHRELDFYSCTVPSFEQYTLARFLSRGYFEKHINRMRKAYKARRNRLIDILHQCPMADRLQVWEQDAGLHFLVRVQTVLSDEKLTARLEQKGLRVRSLRSYYRTGVPTADEHCLVVNYSGLTEEDLARLERLLNTWQ